MLYDKTAIIRDLNRLRTQQPLVHNVTNLVVMQQTANALLAIGALPIMAHAPSELEELLKIAGSLVINMGTLDDEWIHSMGEAMACAQQLQKPIILDPVGAGATKLRTATASYLCDLAAPAIIRGNAGEILSLAGGSVKSKGVDSQYSSDAALDAARALANKYHSTIIVSGAIDYIISASFENQIQNGVALMTQVTGMGCTASAIAGAFIAVQNNSHQAAISAMAIMGIAGEIAFTKAQQPGSFAVAFIDALYSIDEKDIENYGMTSKLL